MAKQVRKDALTELVVQFFVIFALYSMANTVLSGLNTVAMAGSNQVKMIPTTIGVRVLDGEGHPICPPSGVRLVVTQFGPDAWPKEVTAEVDGRPNAADGSMVVKTTFPVHPTFIRHLSQAYEQAPDAKR